MAGRHPEPTAARESRLIAEGRGTGEGPDYKPWLNATEVPSRGRLNRWYGIKARRAHQFLSNLEAWLLPLAEFDQRVTDIREQYPLLPFSRTAVLAAHLGVQPLRARRTSNSPVMTTDLVLSMPSPDAPDRLVAVSMKDEWALRGKHGARTEQKLALEQAYWVSKGVRFCPVTRRDVDPVVCANLSWLREAWLPTDGGLIRSPQADGETRRFATVFLKTTPRKTVAARVRLTGLRIGCTDSIDLFRRSVWLRLIPLDLRVRIRLGHTAVLARRADLGVTFPW